MMTNLSLVAPIKKSFILSLPSRHRNLDHQPGKPSSLMVNAEGMMARPTTSLHVRPRVKVLLNDSYCVTQRGFVEGFIRTDTLVNNCQSLDLNCIAVNDVPFIDGHLQKKATKAQNLPVGARLNQFWKTWAGLGLVYDHKNPRGRLHPAFPEPTNFDQVSNNNKWLYTSPQEQLPGGITCTLQNKAVEKVKDQTYGFFQQTFLGSITQQLVGTHYRSELAAKN